MKALLVIRTPFQAWLAQKVLEKEEIESFDVVYLTQNDSEEDRYYYYQLSKESEQSDYIFVPPQRFDIFSHIIFRLKARSWYFNRNYDCVMYGSIDALVPNSLISNYKYANLITFDDGAANIVNSGIFSKDSEGFRSKCYRTIIGSQPTTTIKNRISRHYTMYSNHKNIVESKRLVFLEGWNNAQSNKNDKVKTYFIGSPFEEIMNSGQIGRLESFVKKQNIDIYVAHPRERNILNIGVPLLDKESRIAEDAIIANADGKGIKLIGWFSTVMLNIGPLCKECIVLLPKDAPQTPELFELSKKSGFNPILI